METENYLCLFADCKLTKGFLRTLAVDLTRGRTYVLENDAYDFIIQCKTASYINVISKYASEEQQGIQELVSYLISKDLCFFSSEPQSFPEISEDWDNPSLITNAIIDIDQEMHNFDQIIPQLTSLGCHDIQIRFFSALAFDELVKLTELISTSAVKSVEYYVKSSSDFTKKRLRDLTKRFFIIKNIIIHSHPKNEAYIIYTEKFRNNMGNIIFLKQAITGESHCGAVSSHYFVNDNLQFYNEGLKFNSCLNRKIGIDKFGVIKNCPSLRLSFGHYREVSLEEAIADRNFKEMWEIPKSKIDVCKDCEYRNICTDCRAYTMDKSNNFAKPAKCSYNPYTGVWANRQMEK